MASSGNPSTVTFRIYASSSTFADIYFCDWQGMSLMCCKNLVRWYCFTIKPNRCLQQAFALTIALLTNLWNVLPTGVLQISHARKNFSNQLLNAQYQGHFLPWYYDISDLCWRIYGVSFTKPWVFFLYRDLEIARSWYQLWSTCRKLLFLKLVLKWAACNKTCWKIIIDETCYIEMTRLSTLVTRDYIDGVGT